MIATLRTLGRVFTGFILACLAAGLVQVLYVETPKELTSIPTSEIAGQARSTLELSLLAATHFAIFSGAFALIAAGIAEWLGLRSPSYWLATGMIIALLGFSAQYASEIPGQPSILNNYALQAYLTAGFFGGLVYWLVSGARSGAMRDRQPAPDSATQDSATATAARPRIIVEDAPATNKPANPVKMGSLAEKLALKRDAKPAAQEAASVPTRTDEARAAETAARNDQSPTKAPAKTDDATKSPSPLSATAVPVTKPEGAAKAAKGQPPQTNPPPAAAVSTPKSV